MQRFTDALNHSFTLAHTPQRIVSLVPSQTELLCDLGLQDRIVGRTRFCIHPSDQLKNVPIVGGTKDFDPDKIMALQPDLILANKEENVKDPLLALRAQIPVWTSDVPDLAAALDMITDVGALTQTQVQSQALCERIRSAFASLKPLPPKPTVLYLIWRKPYMSVGQDTFIHAMLSQLGLHNITGHENRYPSLSPAEVQAANPALIFLSSEPYPFQEKHRAELQTLCPHAQILLVQGDYFSWYGSRLLEASAYFQSLLDAMLSLLRITPEANAP